MMKKYIFFCHTIAGMGGAQMYIRNKILYLQNNGWLVDVIYAVRGVIYIPELKLFDKCYPELEYSYYVCPRAKRERVIKKISNIINTNGEEVFIETGGITESGWGEALAKEIQAKHIVYLLQENNRIRNCTMRSFFLFKHSRKELVSITDSSLFQMFSTFHPISKTESYCLPAYCDNVVADIDISKDLYIEKNKVDYVLGCLSRLDKPFVASAVKHICKYAQKHSETKYLLLLIGGAPDDSKAISTIKDIVSIAQANVELKITGYLFPLPTKLLQMCDVFLSSAGSACVCMRVGVPTITYDANDLNPIGILGQTTQEYLFRSHEDEVPNIDDLLDWILIDKKYPKTQSTIDDKLPDFSQHLDFIEASKPNKSYYDLNLLRPELKREKLDNVCLKVLGTRAYALLRKKIAGLRR